LLPVVFVFHTGTARTIVSNQLVHGYEMEQGAGVVRGEYQGFNKETVSIHYPGVQLAK
jgi:hypothetical protein